MNSRRSVEQEHKRIRRAYLNSKGDSTALFRIVLSVAGDVGLDAALALLEGCVVDKRMAWFREARFGMFIHWGVYAVPAGTYKGKRIGGIGEWIMNRAKIPVAEYKAFAKDFNPVKYDPDGDIGERRRAFVRNRVRVLDLSPQRSGAALGRLQAEQLQAAELVAEFQRLRARGVELDRLQQRTWATIVVLKDINIGVALQLISDGQ